MDQTVLTDLEQAIHRIDGILAGIDVDHSVSAEPADDLLASATRQFMQKGSELIVALQQTQDSVETLRSSLFELETTNPLANNIEQEVHQISDNVDAGSQEFKTLVEELEGLAEDGIRARMSQASEHLSEELASALGILDSASQEVTESLKSEFVKALDCARQSLVDGIVQRLSHAVGDAIDPVAEQILSDLSETFVMTELGANVTALVSPYLPEIIALSLILDEIQAALDAGNLGG
jgi:hypothetical protein